MLLEYLRLCRMHYKMFIYWTEIVIELIFCKIDSITNTAILFLLWYSKVFNGFSTFVFEHPYRVISVINANMLLKYKIIISVRKRYFTIFHACLINTFQLYIKGNAQSKQKVLQIFPGPCPLGNVSFSIVLQ